MSGETYVVYHGNCPGGFTAAWAAHQRLGDSGGHAAAAGFTTQDAEAA
jgi:hypothetical protein